MVRHSGRSEVSSISDALTIRTDEQSGTEACRWRRQVRRSLLKRGARDSVNVSPTAQPCNCRLNRAVQTRWGRDLLQIAARRFREAGGSTVINHTAGGATHSGNCEKPSAYRYTLFG